MLFRSIAKQVRDQNGFAVALGFFVVVAGILIALQVTNLSEAQPEAGNHQNLDVIRDTPFETAFERSDITLLNWQHWPYSRYASHHPREFIPMATIHSDPEAPALKKLDNDPFNLVALKVSVDEQEDVLLPDLLTSIQMKGFAVMHGGEIVFETYDQGMQEHDIQVLQSTSKTFTGMLIHKLANDGLLNLGANVDAYLPDLNASVFDDSTLQHPRGHPLPVLGHSDRDGRLDMGVGRVILDLEVLIFPAEQVGFVGI